MIRRLTDVKHIPRLVSFGRRFHARTASAGIAFSESRAAQLLKSSMVSLDSAVWGAMDTDGKFCGLLIGTIVPWPWCEGSYATDLVFAADRYGAELYRAFEQWAWKFKVNAIQVAVSSGMPQADAFYQAMGMQNTGGMYLQTAPVGAEVAV